MSNPLERDIQFLPGIGPKRAALLASELGIHTYMDLLATYPFRYMDRSRTYAIREVAPGAAHVQIRAKITKGTATGTGRSARVSLTADDGTGQMELIFFQGAKWIREKIVFGNEYIIFGKVTEFNGIPNMVHPEIEPAGSTASYTGSDMTGIYPGTEKLRKNGIGNKVFSKFVYTALEQISGQIQETLPEYIRKTAGLADLEYSLRNIHFPKNNQAIEAATGRLKFEELFYLQLSLLKHKFYRKKFVSGIMMPRIGNAFHHCYSRLPYPLTGAQKRVIREIRADMVSGKQMNRLLQGDVGSGKTAVAFLSCLIAKDNGYQSCIMAPTEVLASQHYENSKSFFEGSGVTCALLTGSTKQKDRREILSALEDGTLDILIGTHALIEENVVFRKIGFAVIDEQHRFGVEQRSKLWKKGEIPPHILVMTATPIPRTLSMTLYGDLDVSVIDELPPGRKPIKTISAGEKDRKRMYEFIRSQIDSGRQVFIVYPLIKESEKMDYKNLEEGYMNIIEEFKAPKYITAVVHGKQKNEDKAYDMNLFASGKAHILVATSVIEVGVNVPNASVMVIESAERFGLSQLHQLRGRVGRGSDRAYCILMTGPKISKESRERIELMCATQDGFKLAEADLRMRGPGDMEGTRQSGMAIDLKIANPISDNGMLEKARSLAEAILEKDPTLSAPANRILAEGLKKVRNEMKDYSDIS